MKKEWYKKLHSAIRKAAVCMGIAVCAAGMTGTMSYAATKVETIEGHPIYDNTINGRAITNGGSEGLTRRSANFPAKYDPRTNGKVTRVEDQGDTNTCWAFSTIAAAESNILKKGYADSSLNLSENHLVYFFFNRQTDATGYTRGDYNKAVNHWAQTGNDLYSPAMALSTWAGVAMSKGSEDNADGTYAPIALPAKQCYQTSYRVKNVYFYNYNVNTVKQAVSDYGAVAIGMYLTGAYWNNETASYYSNVKTSGNHAVTIVGWDDTWSPSKFRSGKQPSSPGAWIVKNSYGPDFGDNGYIYISYQDVNLQEVVAYDMEPTAQSYTTNYQHDGSACPVYTFNIPSGSSVSNIFTAKGSSRGYNEVLKAVSLSTFSYNVNYSIQIYTGVLNANNPQSGTAMLARPQTGTITKAGYNRIELNTPVTLTYGEKYSVVITLTSRNGGKIAVSCDSSYNAGSDWLQYVANVGSGQSFIYSNRSWEDVGKSQQANIRLKAYTVNTTQKTTYRLNTTGLYLSRGSYNRLAVTTNPGGAKRTVYWYTSNPNVVRVASNGTIGGAGYGVAYVTARFASGNRLVSLRCKVVVGPTKINRLYVAGAKNTLAVAWSRCADANGYVIYYSNKANGGYRQLAVVNNTNTTFYRNTRVRKGTYYIKMRPYRRVGNTILYGDLTPARGLVVR